MLDLHCRDQKGIVERASGGVQGQFPPSAAFSPDQPTASHRPFSKVTSLSATEPTPPIVPLLLSGVCRLQVVAGRSLHIMPSYGILAQPDEGASILVRAQALSWSFRFTHALSSSLQITFTSRAC